MPRYVPPKDPRGPRDGEDAQVAQRLLAHAEETLHQIDASVAGPVPTTNGIRPTPPEIPQTESGGSSDERVRQFLYMVTHDLQSPLSAMSLRLNLLERHIAKTDLDGICKDLTVLNDAYGRMRDLVESILAFAESGATHGVDGSVPLDEVVAGALRLYTDHPVFARADLRIHRLPVVRGESQALVRLFQNLIGNAIKYRHPDRPLRLEITAVPDKDNGVSIRVTDNGIGFDATIADSLFAPFTRAHTGPDVPGHGIGLASCARIAQDHDAQLHATGAPGVGATFTLRFPADRIILPRVSCRS